MLLFDISMRPGLVSATIQNDRHFLKGQPEDAAVLSHMSSFSETNSYILCKDLIGYKIFLATCSSCFTRPPELVLCGYINVCQELIKLGSNKRINHTSVTLKQPIPLSKFFEEKTINKLGLANSVEPKAKL